MLALLALTNAIFTPTGYGTQAYQLLTRAQVDGHAVAVASNYGVEGQSVSVNGIYHYPKGMEPYSQDIAKAHLDNWTSRNPDATPLLLTLYDVWVFNNPQFTEMPIASWVPVDHDPAPPKVVEFCKRENVTPIAMSAFGRDALLAAGVEGVRYVPHAIDTQVYAPRESALWVEGETPGRQIMGLPVDDSYFVIGCFDANTGWPSRKGWGERLAAVAEMMRRHDDVALYMHTDPGSSTGGPDLRAIGEACGIDSSRIFLVNQYARRMGIPPEVMAALYSATDVLLSTSYGEGFGLCSIEAQATGTRVVVSDFTAQPELVGDGWSVGGQRWWDATQSSWWQVPSVPEIVDALEQAYAQGRGRSDKARRFVVDNYDADTVYARDWSPLLAELAG
jgi:glycosyltransferase involved in cell wall biosynthesis